MSDPLLPAMEPAIQSDTAADPALPGVASITQRDHERELHDFQHADYPVLERQRIHEQWYMFRPTPQLWTVGVTSGGITTSVSTVVYNTGATTAPSGSCNNAPCQLVFLQVPTSGVVNGNVSPQPIVAIEDGNGNIVAGDVSSITLGIAHYQGSATSPALSSNCSGVENDGVVAFGDCSLNALGKYELNATDSKSSVQSAVMTNFFSVTNAPPAKFVFTSSAATGTASASPGIGPITVSEEDAFGNVTSATSPLTINLSSSSSKGVFSATSGGTGLTSLTIPANSSSTTFYYGDTVAGSPVLSAASPGLLTGTQTETVNAGLPTQLVFTNNPLTVAQGTSATNPIAIAMEDQYGNLATSASATTVTLKSTSSSGIFSASASGSPTTTTVSIPKNTSSVTAYYGDNTIGTPTITASANPSGLTAATQVENILVKPTQLVFSTGTLSGPASAVTNIGPITVTEEGATGIPSIIAQTVRSPPHQGMGSSPHHPDRPR